MTNFNDVKQVQAEECANLLLDIRWKDEKEFQSVLSMISVFGNCTQQEALVSIEDAATLDLETIKVSALSRRIAPRYIDRAVRLSRLVSPELKLAMLLHPVVYMPETDAALFSHSSTLANRFNINVLHDDVVKAWESEDLIKFESDAMQGQIDCNVWLMAFDSNGGRR